MTAMRRIGFGAFVALVVGAPASGRADDESAAELIRRGVALRHEHRNAEALQLFSSALAIDPTPSARAQVALAEQALGQWLDAERDLDAVLALLDDRWIEKNRTILEQARKIVRRHLAWLTVDVDAPSAKAQLDGRTIPCGSEARVPAGAGILEVKADGYTTELRRVTLGPAEHVHETVSLVPLVAPPQTAISPETPSPAPPSPAVVAPAPALRAPLAHEVRPRHPVPLGPLALGLAGIAGIATGTYFSFRATDDKSAERAACEGGCRPEAKDDWNHAQSAAAISTVAFSVGLALGVAAGAWWLLWPQSPQSGRVASIRVAPWVGQRSGVVLRADLP
jgi:hypothetical protein